jgi:hypothetical protein
MTEASVSFAGNLTDDPELRHTDDGITRATFRVAVSGRSRDSEPSFFTVVVWRDQAEHAAESLRRAAAWWSWAGSSSGHGPLKTAAPGRWSRSLPRSWARACDGRPPRRSRPPGPARGSDPEPRRPPGRCGGAGRGWRRAACRRPTSPCPCPLSGCEDFLYTLKAGPAGGRLRRPSSAGKLDPKVRTRSLMPPEAVRFVCCEA